MVFVLYTRAHALLESRLRSDVLRLTLLSRRVSPTSKITDMHSGGTESILAILHTIFALWSATEAISCIIFAISLFYISDEQWNSGFAELSSSGRLRYVGLVLFV